MAKSTRQINCLKLALTCLVIAILGFLLMGCGHYHKWDTKDKVLFTGLIVASAADIITTNNALDNGGEEKNSIKDLD